MPYLILPSHLRGKLKEPFGEIKKSVDELDLKGLIVSVGDRTTKELLKRGIKPKICIYDGLIERQSVGISDHIEKYDAKKIQLENPPGRLNLEAFVLIEKLLESKTNTKIEVSGEEDLLTLAVIDVAPEGLTVVYGQPQEGIIAVKIDKKTKQKIKYIIEEMQNED